jgi:hypothetical protein
VKQSAALLLAAGVTVSLAWLLSPASPLHFRIPCDLNPIDETWQRKLDQMRGSGL